MEKQTKKKRKAVALSMAMAAMLLPVGASAQGGLFGHSGIYKSEPNQSLMGRGIGDGLDVTMGNESFGETGGEIENEPFDAPMGVGILLAAGMGYALIQSKKNKQN